MGSPLQSDAISCEFEDSGRLGRLVSAKNRAILDVPHDILLPEDISVHVITAAGICPGGLEFDDEWLSHEPMRSLLRIKCNVIALEDSPIEELVSEMASLLQDAVVDLSGKPWPLAPDGTVLDTAMISNQAV